MTNQFIPNLFILGAAKCGTTTVHGYLRSLPNICMSNPKEPFFFESEYEAGLAYYKEKYFSHWDGEGIIGESRHRNLYLPYVPKRIFDLNPSSKLIVIARDPVERCYSHWFHLYSTKDENLSFDAAIKEDHDRITMGFNCSTQEEILQHSKLLEKRHPKGEIGLGLYRTYLDSGYYMQQIRRYLNLFPESQMKIVLFEEMVRNPEKVLGEIVGFLDAQDPEETFKNPMWLNKKKEKPLWAGRYKTVSQLSKFVSPSLKKYMKALLVRKNDMNKKTRHWLIEHYQPHNSDMEKYLRRNISFWQH